MNVRRRDRDSSGRSYRPSARRAALVTGAAAALVAGLVGVGAGSAPAASTAGAASATAGERGGTPAYLNERLSTKKRVADLLSRMTLAEKIGQMTQAERANASQADVTDLALGSILSGGGSTPTPNTAEGWADMVDGYQDAALATRLKIPVLYGVDSVHGHANLNGATVFPHNIGLGATRDPRLVEKISHITAEETRATGPQWSFAPCLCVARDDRWGRTYESFGESPRLVSEMAVAVRGFQGRRGQLDNPDRVLATPKHFAGDGLTTFGTSAGDYTIDQGITIVSRRDFARLALAPYWPAIQRYGAGSVMPSFSSVDWTEDGVGTNVLKMTAHKELLTGVLKGRMGFDGLVISDWEAIHQLPGDWNTQVRTAINAGIDMAMEPAQFEEFITALTEEVQAGRVRMSRIDDAVSRILTQKFELGLFEKPYTDRRNIDEIGSAQHRKVAREAVAKSQVLLKNRGRVLPLSKRAPLYVAGSNADNIGNQAGGWTITWQGGSYHQIPGDTILDGIDDASRRDVTFDETASTPVPRNATGVVVVGETPYAEGFGDVGGPRWESDPGDNGVPRPVKDMKLSTADQRAVDTVCTQAAECVVIVISGRPLEIPPALLSKIDGLVAGWLPGSEGAGVADVLFGKKRFTGTLPVTWPRSVDQEPINVGDADYDPLYPYGFGLRAR
ncbi:glycoside hydrolase family 3 protein [Mumia sp. zg.B21]|uniref:glycoside hydrolase family 3 protein n=1 Tax=Mumia sp. zg.B21 TaxID=2855447 RepID=UPI001C6F059C|nr:glycoside hydrolase family 3 protein [Mumia sp. zg.B21]MBW9211061.1 glycoside hydrolase family 3 protein [Mumia sp. zg.B21]